TARMFGIEYRKASDAPVWHADVTAWEIVEQGQVIGRFFLDLFPREGKYKHAAQFTITSGQEGRALPEGALVCNFPRPPALLERMRAADEFGKGLRVRQQMFYAATSLRFHDRDPAGLDTTALAGELQERYTPFRHVPGTYFQESFGHLEGYSAIYYTYMWSLVIAKDLFGVFRREGLLNPEAALRYRRRILERGGSRPAGELVKDFLGREASFD